MGHFVFFLDMNEFCLLLVHRFQRKELDLGIKRIWIFPYKCLFLLLPWDMFSEWVGVLLYTNSKKNRNKSHGHDLNDKLGFSFVQFASYPLLINSFSKLLSLGRIIFPLIEKERKKLKKYLLFLSFSFCTTVCSFFL